MVLAMSISLLTVIMRELGVESLSQAAHTLLGHINFSTTLLNGMLGYLLFAGALQINVADLKKRIWEIVTFATFSTVVSAALIGCFMWAIGTWAGLTINPLYYFIFGALISPTDPVAVLAILKTTRVPRMLRITISGESLLNDGMGVVVFVILLDLLHGEKLSAGQATSMFILEAFGGALLGAALGYVVYKALKQVHDYKTEILMTIALATACYALAATLHMSGPIAAVAAGLVIGNKGKRLAMSKTTRQHLDNFWDLVDEVLNTVLFALIGLEVLQVHFNPVYSMVGLLAILATLLARAVSVMLPLQWFTALSKNKYSIGATAIMTWGGLRGGVSIALALLIPRGDGFDVVLTATYIVVAFSMIVQGLTIKKLAKHYGY